MSRLILLLLFVTSALCADVEFDLKAAFRKIEMEMTEMKDHVSGLSGQVKLLTGQIMMQQLSHEENVRASGSSGLKQTRIVGIGTRPYLSDSHTGRRLAAIHNHADHIRTMGMGEVVAVINGVEFKTRHNDYQLMMPGRTKTFRQVEDIPYPEVPAEVLNKATVEEQITELREWFKAWSDSDWSVRDYRKYFKPNLCYMEGFWSLPRSDGKVDEPFVSERHALDAASWQELLQKVRFSAYTGRKDAAENYAFLPTKIIDVINGTYPVFAQWNYRILCHPVEHHIPLNGFRVVDDLLTRTVLRNQDLGQLAKGRAARFQLNYNLNKNIDWKERRHFRSFMDLLMEDIPGLDNQGANLVDNAFGYTAHTYDSKDYTEDAPKLNVARYHRYFKEFKKGAMGATVRKRAFSDPAVYMAMTSQEQVAPSTLKNCDRRGRNCKFYKQRWSYAIPLEIVYTTPLQTWNPYHITYHGSFKDKRSRVVTNGGRNGQGVEKAFNGTNSNHYYLTPEAFFKGGEIREGDKADTARNFAFVLDSNGTAQRVSSSGIKIFMPNIPGVGTLRQRWPISPVHGEGGGAWKETDVLKDVVMEPEKYCGVFYEPSELCNLRKRYCKPKKRRDVDEDDDELEDVF